MKIKYLLIAFAFFAISKNTRANPIDTTLHILKNFNYAAYVGKPVDSLVKALPPGVIDIKILPSHNYKIGNNLVLTYNNQCHVWIRVETFRFFNKWYNFSQPPQGQWDISLFKKEKIAWTVVYQGSACLVGCDKQFL